ncbi:LOW QUALITY PROTEIN: WD repeat-containing protein 53 [Asparagus officinalis]|nr:LOW QUALITY PROTEIN: WD repeat-containing protein 53 [Asparagus officinalis]
MKPRRLKGHNAAATCCIAAASPPGVRGSAPQDACMCWLDLRCKDVIFYHRTRQRTVSSLCSKLGNEDVVYASSGTQISCIDVHMASSTWKPLETYSYNKEEINQIAFSPNSYFLAAADDSGDVKIIDTRQQCLYKTLRGVHSSICSSVQFLSWKSWSAITGGLDSKLAMWDFSRGRAYKVKDYGNICYIFNNVGQCFNPAFVHSIAVPEIDVQAALSKVCAVARGDGVVDVIQLESEPVSSSKTSVHHNNKSQLRSKDGKKKIKDDNEMDQSLGQRVQLDYALGGHTAAVSCVSFSLFGEKGRFLISGGNDASVKLWDWSKHFKSGEANSNDETVLSMNVNKKVNWLCTTPSDSENLILCDTSKVLKVYTVP